MNKKTINSYLYIFLHTQFLLFLFFYLYFWAGPSAAHMGWAKQHACANAHVLLHCASELIHLHSVKAI
jgi:hypothetical protein